MIPPSRNFPLPISGIFHAMFAFISTCFVHAVKQVQAFTSAGEGQYTEIIFANTSVVKPVPTLLVAARDSITVTDCDREMYKVLFSGDQPTDATLNSHERTVYWLNEMHEILSISLDGTGKTKVSNLIFISSPKVITKET